jgi:hypothetical protein
MDIPQAPCLMPTPSEFLDPLSYIYTNETMLTSFGAFKIIPLIQCVELKKTTNTMISIPRVLKQHIAITHTPQLYRITNSFRKLNKKQKNIKLKAFESRVRSENYQPSYTDVDDELNFWNTLTLGPKNVEHVVDLPYSLLSQNEMLSNLHELPLRSLLGITSQRGAGKYI